MLWARRATAAALDDADHGWLSAKQNTDERQEFFNQANARMNRWIDSQSYLVMMKGSLPPQKTIEHLQKNEILLESLIQQMPKYVRVSLEKPKEMPEFWHDWDARPAHPMAM